MDAPRRCGKCKSPYWDRVNGKSVCSVSSRRSGIARQVQAGESGKGGLQEVPRGEVGGGFSEHIQIEAEVMLCRNPECGKPLTCSKGRWACMDTGCPMWGQEQKVRNGK